MRKTVKRVITLCLAVIMLTSLMCVSSFAAGKTCEVYTALGDSVGSGYGLPSYHKGLYPPTTPEEIAAYDFNVYDTYDTKVPIEGSYPVLVSEGVSAKTANLYCKSGYRTAELRDLLDKNWTRPAMDQYFLYGATSFAGNEAVADVKAACKAAAAAGTKVVNNAKLEEFNKKFNAQSDNYIKAVKEADVITLNFGSNDTFSYGMYSIETENWIPEMSAAILEGYENYKENFDEIIRIIHEDLNPNAKIYIVGMYNPFRGATLTDSTYLQLGNMADAAVNLVNNYTLFGSSYRNCYTYVNIMETESWGFATVSEMLDFTDAAKAQAFAVKIHPNVEGHKYIANQVIKAINGQSTATNLFDKLFDRIGDANDKTEYNINKIGSSISSSNEAIKAAINKNNNGYIEYLKKLIKSGSDSSDSKDDANTSADEVKELQDVSFDTVNHNSYVNGSNGYFRPDDSLTRAEAAKILYNLLTVETKEKYETNTNKFSDVSASEWYNKPVSTLVATGAIKGYTDNTFKPTQSITRAEFVKMVMGIVGINSSATPSFKDTSTDTWYSAAVGTAQKAGYVEGSNGNFRPSDNITRAEAVKIMNGILGRVADVTYIANNTQIQNTFVDVPSSAWYYKYVMEAAIGHNHTSANNTETWTSLK